MDLEEALAQADVYAEETEVCTIDAATRTISVPAQLRLFGVENDKRVERIYFHCPKIVGDNQDLSKDYQLFMNYQNANGDPDAYHIQDMEVDGDNITFSWLLEENVTKYRGNIQFAFGAIIPGDEAEDPDKNRWNTTINTDCTCLVGLECTQQVAESDPDALAQIWSAIDELKAGGGTAGKDGREIELQNSGTAIQWRYVGDNAWTDLVQLSELKGDPGDDGITPNIQIGTVQTLEPEQQATASVTGSKENPLLNLGIPRGQDGSGSGSSDNYIPLVKTITLDGESVENILLLDDITMYHHILIKAKVAGDSANQAQTHFDLVNSSFEKITNNPNWKTPKTTTAYTFAEIINDGTAIVSILPKNMNTGAAYTYGDIQKISYGLDISRWTSMILTTGDDTWKFAEGTEIEVFAK